MSSIGAQDVDLKLKPGSDSAKNVSQSLTKVGRIRRLRLHAQSAHLSECMN